MTRYALYFTPSPESLWSAVGNHWLGRNAETGQVCAQPEIAGLSKEQFSSMTADARRYGFHATLKAPFRLADGFTEADLLKMAEAFCAAQKPIALREPYIDLDRDFLALRVPDASDEINLLANRCTSYFDLLRAVPTAGELAKRRRESLTPRQEALLQRWGYPHTEELFRFHMTLSGSLKTVGPDVVVAVVDAATRHFSDAIKQRSLKIDGLTILREDHPGAPFITWRRFDFDARNKHATLPAVGRLFYCVGPPGVGKAAVLQWVQQHLADQDRIVFAQRTITRPAYFNERHEAVDFANFWQLAAGGQLAMVWQNNDLCYGIRRNIVAALKAGSDVVVNGSTSYLPQLHNAFPEAIVVWIGGQEHLMRARRDAHQSEAGPVSLKRLYRCVDFMPPDDPQVVPLDNRGPLEVVGKRLLGLFSER